MITLWIYRVQHNLTNLHIHDKMIGNYRQKSERDNRAFIAIEDMETRSLYDKNIEDLKTFYQMIILIN